jgi:hypothetical protein
MKNYKKQLLSLLSITTLLASGSYLHAMKGRAQREVIDVDTVTHQTPYELLRSHEITTQQTAQRATEQAAQERTKNNEKDLNNNANISEATQAFRPEESLGLNLEEATLVTPAAMLKSVLQTSNNYQEAFEKLSSTNNAELPREQQQLIQQARTLLVRAHPELVEGLVNNLAYLPNRFMSYFKEKLPTLYTTAGRKRFTQSIMMETIKSMPELPQNEKTIYIPLEKRPFSNFSATTRPLKLSEKQQVFNASFNEQFNAISAKYTIELKSVTTSEMFLQWSRNVITDIALLAPRTIGATLGVGIGAVDGAISGTINGGVLGGTLGTLAGRPTAEVYFNSNAIGASGGIIGGGIGQIAGAPAHAIGLDTAAAVTGGVVGATTGAGLGAVTGTIGGITSGAAYGANAFENAGRYAYNTAFGS